MNYDLIIKNAMVVFGDCQKQLDIGVSDGKIVMVREGMTDLAAEVLDATGLHLFAGLCDAHCHFDEPGRTEWETIKTGSAALAAGGGTLYFDMPLNSYATTCDVESFHAKKAVAEKDSFTDFGIWGGLTPYSLDKLEAMVEAGVIGFKAFSCFTGIGGIDRACDYTLYRGMQKIARLHVPLMVHSENAEITRGLTNEFLDWGKVSAKDYFASRPVITEIENVKRMILFAEDTGARVIIAHVSTAKAVELVSAARIRGVDIYCETIGHYLAYTEDDVERIGANAKCSPPIRDKANQAKLWDRFYDNEIAFVSSDHSPCEPRLKEGEFLKAWGGITGCQSTLPLLLTEGYHKRGIKLSQIARASSANVCELFNVKKKGKIAGGYDADFVLVDLKKGYELEAEDLFYKHKISLYVGYKFQVRVVRTILRGRTVFKDGKLIGEPCGKIITPIRN